MNYSNYSKNHSICCGTAAINPVLYFMSIDSLPLDPPPEPPAPPDDNACCNSGCTYCILDMYQEELAAYRLALAAWQQRQQPSGKSQQN